MRRALALPAVVLPLSALLLTACGGGDGDTEKDKKAAYVAEAGKVCQTAKGEVDALQSPTRPADVKPLVDTSIAIAKRVQGDLAALTPPEADRAELETKVLKPFGELVTEGEAFAAKVADAGGNQVKLLALLSELPKPEGIDLEFLRSYGLGVCADVIEDQPLS